MAFIASSSDGDPASAGHGTIMFQVSSFKLQVPSLKFRKHNEKQVGLFICVVTTFS